MGCEPEYNVVVGPPVLKFNKELARVWNKDHFIVYTSGMSGDKIGALYDDMIERIPDGMFHERDFSRFDKTVSVPLLALENKTLARWGMQYQALTYMAHMAEKKTGHSRHGVKFQTDGTRGSGEPDTSCGNSEIHGCCLIDAICHVGKVTPTELLTANLSGNPILVFMVVGDDELGRVATWFVEKVTGLIGFEAHRKFAELVDDELLDFGLQPETVVREHDREATYCSSLFWPTTAGTILGPKPFRALYKIGYYHHPPHEKYHNQLVRGDMLGRRLSSRFIPILGDYVEHVISITKPEIISEHIRTYLRKDRGLLSDIVGIQADATDETWNMFYDRYHLTIAEVTEFQQSISTIKTLPCTIHFDWMWACMLIDNE
jgi:hypothetical protein